MGSLWKKLVVAGAIGGVAIACSVTSTTNGPDLTDASTSSSSGGDGGGSSSGKDGQASSSGGDTGASSGSDGSSCTINIDFGAAACNTCAEGKCCAEINACFNPPGSDCDKLDTCLTTCIDEAGSPSTDAGAVCANDCFTAYAGAKSTWLTQAKCLLDNCKTECGG
jgi:hypothetical protein